MVLTVVGAGLAVSIGPRGLGHKAAMFSPAREAELRVAGGSSRIGAMAIRTNGCAECHAIPGIPGSAAVPSATSLEHFGNRTLIAGALPNTPENLSLWLQEPTRFTPQTQREGHALDERTATNIAAYLYGN